MVLPGDLVFSDQYESRLPGKVFTYKGSGLKTLTYKGGTVFCDSASGYISQYCQSSFTSDETVISKLRFEREAMGSGVVVSRYRTDNGVYTASGFLDELKSTG